MKHSGYTFSVLLFAVSQTIFAQGTNLTPGPMTSTNTGNTISGTGKVKPTKVKSKEDKKHKVQIETSQQRPLVQGSDNSFVTLEGHGQTITANTIEDAQESLKDITDYITFSIRDYQRDFNPNNYSFVPAVVEGWPVSMVKAVTVDGAVSTTQTPVSIYSPKNGRKLNFEYDISNYSVVRASLKPNVDSSVKKDKYFVFQLFLKKKGSTDLLPVDLIGSISLSMEAVTFQAPVTYSPSIAVAGPATYANGLTIENAVTISGPVTVSDPFTVFPSSASLPNADPRVWYLTQESFDGGDFYIGEMEPVLYLHDTGNPDFDVLKKELFSIDTNNLHVRTAAGGKWTSYQSVDGDEMVLKAYALRPVFYPGKSNAPDTNKSEPVSIKMWTQFSPIPVIQNNMFLKIREYGFFIRTSPTILFATSTTSSSWDDFNITKKAPDFGENFSFDYKGDGRFDDWDELGLIYPLVNGFVPGITLTYLTNNGTTDFSPGISLKLPIFSWFNNDLCRSISENIRIYYGLHIASRTNVLGLLFTPAAFDLMDIKSKTQENKSHS